MDLLQINKFGELHDGKRVVFCRTDDLAKDFARIRRIKENVVLISGNSDLSVDDNLINAMPENISKWYCQNLVARHERVQVIPLGLENTFASKRKGHGVAWQHAISKINCLDKLTAEGTMIIPDKLLYSNFNEQTNPAHRTPLKLLSQRMPHIDWDGASLPYQDFIGHVLEHEATLCPAGNGLDTHRIYEVLYAGRVAVTLKIASSPVYDDLYEHLPVVILENIEQLEDADLLRQLINTARQKRTAMELLDFRYWRQLILASRAPHVEAGKGAIRTLLKTLSKRFNT